MASLERQRRTGEAQAVGGAGLALGIPAVSRVERGVTKLRLKQHDKKIARARADIPTRAPRGGVPVQQPTREANARFSSSNKRVSNETKYRPKSAPQREALRLQRKAGYSKLRQLEGARKAIAKPRVFPHQSKLWVAGVGAGVPLSYLGARRAVRAREQMGKRMDQSDVNAAYAGGAGAGIGYQGGVMLTKPIDWKNEKKIKNDPKLHATMKQHEAKYRPKGMTAGDPRFRQFFQHYPKELPGGRMKRVLSHTHTGKTGGLATLGIIGAGAAGAVHVNRQEKRKQMSKSYEPGVSAFGIDHGEFSKFDYGSNKKPSGGRKASAAAFGTWHGAVAGKKGKKLRAAGNEGGMTVAGSALGGLGGAVLGAAPGLIARHGGAAKVGAMAGQSVGGIGGALYGSQKGLARNTRKGYLKKEPK